MNTVKSMESRKLGVMTAAVLSVLVTLAIGAIGTLGAGKAYAADDPVTVVNGDFTYKAWFDGGPAANSVFLTAYTGKDTQVIVPAQFTKDGTKYPCDGGFMCVETGAFTGNTKVEKVAVEPGPEVALGAEAFAGCTALTEIAIGAGEDYQGIGTDAFTGCARLTTYRIGGTNVYGIESSGIGQDADGNIYPGVTVHAVKGGTVDEYVQKLNAAAKEKDPNANQITLVYEADPYAGHTVKPTSSTPGTGTGTGDTPLTVDPEQQVGKDGTPLGEGASEKAADTALTKYSKETDPKGSVFSLLQARLSNVTAKSLKLSWAKAKGAKKYVVYGNMCGSKNKQVKLATTKKTAITFKKVNKKAVKKGTYYKFTVVAIDKNGKVIATSKIVHAATKGGKVGNDKAVTTVAKKDASGRYSVTLKKGKTFDLKAKAVPASKKLKVKQHRGVAFETDDATVATVSKKGVVKAKKKGTCYVYAYAQNGVFAKVKVTVK